MERELYRLVNRAFAGEPEDIVLQKVGGFDIIELSDIHKVSEMVAGIREWNPNEDLTLLLQSSENEFYIHTIDNERIIYVV